MVTSLIHIVGRAEAVYAKPGGQQRIRGPGVAARPVGVDAGRLRRLEIRHRVAPLRRRIGRHVVAESQERRHQPLSGANRLLFIVVIL